MSSVRAPAMTLTTATIAALWSGVVAGVVIVGPLYLSWAADFSPATLTSWTGAAAVASAVTVAAQMAVRRLGGRVLAWGWVLLAVGVLFASYVLALTGTHASVAQRYVDAALGGLVLGATTVAVWGRRAPTLGLIAGVAIGFSLARPFSKAWHLLAESDPGSASYLDPLRPAYLSDWQWWPLLLAALLVLGALVFELSPIRTTAPDKPTNQPHNSFRHQGFRLLVALLLVVPAGYGTGELVHVFGDDSWAVRALGLALLLVLYAIAARMPPYRDGRFFLAALAVTAAVSAVEIPNDSPTIFSWQLIGIAALLLLLGVLIAGRWPSATGGIVILAATTAVGMVNFDDPASALAVRLLVVAFAAGYVLASTIPHGQTSGALGVAALFVPAAPAALAGTFTIEFGWTAYTPLTTAGWHPTTHSAFGASLALALLILGAGAAMGATRPRR